MPIIRPPDPKEMAELQRVFREWLEREVHGKVAELRSRHGHMVYVDIGVVTPICSGCAYSQARWMEEVMTHPAVSGEDWKRDYQWELGASWKEILAVARALRDGTWAPRCRRCSSDIDTIGEGFYTDRESLTEFFDLPVRNSRKVPDWMRRAVIGAFGDRCAGCGAKLVGQLTMDHVVPHSLGGRTEVTNLQPLCQSCNQSKGAAAVPMVRVDLTFPLRPPPSDGFEGAFW